MKLSRRSLIQQAALWPVLWPILRSESALAETDLAPKRVIIIFSPNGPIMERGPASGSETKFQIHDWWKPLERHKADGLFFAGMHQAGVPFGEHNEYGHQSAGTGALTARTTEGTNNATGPSLDQFIGQQLQASEILTPQRSLLWGLHSDTGNWGPWYEGAGKPVSPEANPFLALDAMLPNLPTKVDEGPDPRLLRKKLVLDRAYKDCKGVLSRLGAGGKELLDFHCNNIESLQKGVQSALDSPRSPACVPVERPDTELGADANWDSAENNDERMKAFISLMPLAFSCDVTRVIGFSFGATAARFSIPSTYGIPSSEQVDSGDSGAQHHAWTHVYNESDDKRKALGGFTQWYAEQVARIVDALKATPDVNGKSLFDSTLVLWTGELGHKPDSLEPHPNNHLPVTLFGNGLGSIKTGRFYDGGGEESSALTLHQLFVSMIHHVGLTHINQFGNKGSGPLDWLQG